MEKSDVRCKDSMPNLFCTFPFPSGSTVFASSQFAYALTRFTLLYILYHNSSQAVLYLHNDEKVASKKKVRHLTGPGTLQGQRVTQSYHAIGSHALFLEDHEYGSTDPTQASLP